jgi:hypothetical protein
MPLPFPDEIVALIFSYFSVGECIDVWSTCQQFRAHSIHRIEQIFNQYGIVLALPPTNALSIRMSQTFIRPFADRMMDVVGILTNVDEQITRYYGDPSTAAWTRHIPANPADPNYQQLRLWTQSGRHQEPPPGGTVNNTMVRAVIDVHPPLHGGSFPVMYVLDQEVLRDGLVLIRQFKALLEYMYQLRTQTVMQVRAMT